MQSPSPSQPTSPTIITQSTPNSTAHNSKQKYLCSVIGLCRIGIIVSWSFLVFALYFRMFNLLLVKLFQLAGWIAAASVPIYINGLAYLPPELSATRDAYLFFSITGFVVAIVIFVVYFFNLTNKKPLNKLPNDLFVWIMFEMILFSLIN